MNTKSSLTAELKEKAYRDAYVASQIRIGLPLQSRALRKSRDWKQEELAERAHMAQPRISEIESPGERNLNIETLLRLASAFDVGLQIRFVPFSELIDWSEDLDLDTFTIEPFEKELEEAEKLEQIESKYSIRSVIAVGDKYPIREHRPRIKGSIKMEPKTDEKEPAKIATFHSKKQSQREMQPYSNGAMRAAQ